jgi:hypothetical protein
MPFSHVIIAPLDVPPMAVRLPSSVVEHPPCKRKVFGSIPKGGSSFLRSILENSPLSIPPAFSLPHRLPHRAKFWSYVSSCWHLWVLENQNLPKPKNSFLKPPKSSAPRKLLIKLTHMGRKIEIREVATKLGLGVSATRNLTKNNTFPPRLYL